MLLLHAINVFFTSLAVVGTVLFTDKIIREITGDRLAGMAGGLVLLSIPYLYMYASMGFRSKIYVICFGALSVLCQLKKRPFWSGMFAVVSAGFWQVGIIYPILSLGIPFQQKNARALRRTLIGILLAGLLVLLPIIYWGALEAMLVEVIIAPLIVGEPLHFLYRVTRLILWSEVALLTMILGLSGGLIMTVRGPEEHRWWLGIGLVFSLVQVFLVDLDSHQDTFILLWFVSIGAGYLVHCLEARQTAYVIVIIGLSVLLNWGLHLDGFGPERIALPEIQSTWLSAFQKPDPPENSRARNYPGRWRNRDFWNRRMPERCHYRFSSVEKGWLDLTKQSATTNECGRLKHIRRIRPGL